MKPIILGDGYRHTSKIRHGGHTYMGALAPDGIDVSVLRDGEQIAVGMYEHGLLDCGDDAKHVPEPVWERLHDALEALTNDEDDEDDEV